MNVSRSASIASFLLLNFGHVILSPVMTEQLVLSFVYEKL